MAHDAIQAIKQLRRDVVEAMRSLMKLAKEKQTSGMLPICEDMISKTRILLSLWDPGLVEEALTFLEEFKVAKVEEDDDPMSLDLKGVNQTLSPFKRITQQLNFDLKSPDLDDFVTPDTPECVQDIWAKSAVVSKHKYVSLAMKNEINQNNLMEDNFVIFPDVEDDSAANGKLDNNNEDDDKNDSDMSKRFLDMQKMCNSPSANYYKPTDEPEPWDLTQLNIEASVMCLVSKVKFLCGRCSSPAVRLRHKNNTSTAPFQTCRHHNNIRVVTTQPKNLLKTEEASKLLLLDNSSKQNSPCPDKAPATAFSKAKEGSVERIDF